MGSKLAIKCWDRVASTLMLPQRPRFTPSHYPWPLLHFLTLSFPHSFLSVVRCVACTVRPHPTICPPAGVLSRLGRFCTTPFPAQGIVENTILKIARAQKRLGVQCAWVYFKKGKWTRVSEEPYAVPSYTPPDELSRYHSGMQCASRVKIFAKRSPETDGNTKNGERRRCTISLPKNLLGRRQLYSFQ